MRRLWEMSESPWLLKSGSVAYRGGPDEPDTDIAHDLFARSPKYDGHAPHATEPEGQPVGSTE
ncbi:MAG TPA: hypothetical protein VMA36_10365 [Candidatus Limnocylindria bacterium]|jgi:hypothetical protein|nr:hypothetical protein [Candidatus Limnocylindria bacterium]